MLITREMDYALRILRAMYQNGHMSAAAIAQREHIPKAVTLKVLKQLHAAGLGNYLLKNGRMQTFRLGAHHGTLLTSKHENSIAYDTNLRYIAASEQDCAVLVIVDAVSRKYFTSETSWLWDIDFGQLDVPHVKRVLLSGRYSGDLAERFSFTALPPDRWSVQPDIAAAAEELRSAGNEDLYVVTCFSDRDKLLSRVEKEA